MWPIKFFANFCSLLHTFVQFIPLVWPLDKNLPTIQIPGKKYCYSFKTIFWITKTVVRFLVYYNQKLIVLNKIMFCFKHPSLFRNYLKVKRRRKKDGSNQLSFGCHEAWKQRLGNIHKWRHATRGTDVHSFVAVWIEL